jgi:hypothetical protein
MVGESWVPLSQYSARRYQPTDADSSSSSSATTAPGTTINTTTNATAAATPSGAPANQDILGRLKSNISGIESGGDYNILGKTLKNGDYAIGKYQVMASNVPDWTKAALGQSMTPAQFRANPQAQEKVADYQLGNYLNQYGPAGAASMWFSGSPNIHSSAKDVLGTSVPSYIARATQGITDFTPGPGRTPTGAAPAVAATPGTSITSTAVPADTTGVLPGFGSKEASDKFTSGLEQINKGMGGGDPSQGGQGGQEQQPPQMPPMPQTPFGGRNVGPLGGPMVGAATVDPRLAAGNYGTLLNSVANMQPGPVNPTAAAPGAQPGAPPGAGYGPQPAMMPAGLTALQMQQLSPYALGMQQSPYGTGLTSTGGLGYG